jgi:tyrosinase
VNGSYAIYVFMGDFDDTPAAWSTSPNLVGTHAVFAAISNDEAASNPQSKVMTPDSSIKVTGTMPLTSMLLDKATSGELESLRPSIVEDYLEANLQWRVGMVRCCKANLRHILTLFQFDGTQIPVEDLADLTITVITAKMQPAASEDQFPEWSDFTKLTRITQGKPGGC